MKINIGLTGILIIIMMSLGQFFYLKSINEQLYEELAIVKSFVEDIDDDIHIMIENKEK
tara:strand:+ start:82 stop:258 length:177 start_codon:yes stop_codon:yes gene_type:complete